MRRSEPVRNVASNVVFLQSSGKHIKHRFFFSLQRVERPSAKMENDTAATALGNAPQTT